MNLTITNWERIPGNKKMNFFLEMEAVLAKYFLEGWFDE